MTAFGRPQLRKSMLTSSVFLSLWARSVIPEKTEYFPCNLQEIFQGPLLLMLMAAKFVVSH